MAQVADSAAAVDSLKRTGFPIVLCDRDLAGGEWQDTLRLLHSVRDRPCVILLSNVADEYLWNEVVRRGGFDVLTRPFRKEQVVSMLEFAYTYWKTAWPVPKS